MTDLVDRTDAPDAGEGDGVRPSVHPLSGHTGAEIRGIDIAAPLCAADRGVIEGALEQWKVVVFRDQALDHERQIRFASQFGPLTYAHPYDDDPPEGFPEIYTVDPDRFAATYGLSDAAAAKVRRRYSYTNQWHTDVTPAINPPAASVLRADVVPDYGGDTTFTNLVAAYEDLSAPVKALLDGLQAEHRYGAGFARAGLDGASPTVAAAPLVSRHPVVRVHPFTGERGLFVNPGFTSRIVGVSRRESEAILGLLFDQITRPAFTVRISWAAGTVAFWDNRVTAHLGPQDIDHLDVRRVLHRVTLIGEVPVGADGRESTPVSGEPFTVLPARNG
jgi:taurine dioxygenase